MVSSLRLAVAGAVLLAAASTGHGILRSPTWLYEVELDTIRGNLVAGVTHSERGEPTEAMAALEAALGGLDALVAFTREPGFGDEVGLKAGKARKQAKRARPRVKKARKAVLRRKAESAVKVRKAFEKVEAVHAKTFGYPVRVVLDETSSKPHPEGAFRDPGTEILIRVLGCDEPVTNVQVSSGVGSPDVVASLDTTRGNGLLVVTLGGDDGGATISFYACSEHYEQMVYNYGADGRGPPDAE